MGEALMYLLIAVLCGAYALGEEEKRKSKKKNKNNSDNDITNAVAAFGMMDYLVMVNLMVILQTKTIGEFMVTYQPIHCHSMYSLLDGMSKPADMAERCIEIGATSCALTDHGNIAGKTALLRDA